MGVKCLRGFDEGNYLFKPIPQDRIINKVNLHDYPTVVLADRAGIDIVMIGDSIGMVVLGYETTIPVTMEEMIHHAKAVVREANTALLCAICLSCHEKRKRGIPYYLCPSLYLFPFSGSWRPGRDIGFDLEEPLSAKKLS